MGRKKEKSDEEILKAARQCFVKHGPTVATSVIARELGISQATLFNRFKTKRELMLSALAPSTSANRLFEILRRPPDSNRTVREQLVDIGYEAYQFFKMVDPNLAVLTATGMTREQLRECYDASPIESSYVYLSHWIEQVKQTRRVGDVDPQHFARAYLGAIRSSAKAVTDNGEHAAEDHRFVEKTVDLFWTGLSPASTISSLAHGSVDSHV